MTRHRITRALTPAALVLAAALLAGCGGGRHDRSTPDRTPGPAPGTPTSAPPPTNGILDGHLRFTVLSLVCGIPGVTGTHSEAEPTNGQYCEAKLRVENTDQDYHDYVPQQQRLEGAASPDNEPDGFAMAVRRQAPDPIVIGGSDAIEIELWFDIPAGAQVTGLRIRGDADPKGFLDDTPVKHAADGVVIPWRPTLPGQPTARPS